MVVKGMRPSEQMTKVSTRAVSVAGTYVLGTREKKKIQVLATASSPPTADPLARQLIPVHNPQSVYRYVPTVYSRCKLFVAIHRVSEKGMKQFLSQLGAQPALGTTTHLSFLRRFPQKAQKTPTRFFFTFLSFPPHHTIPSSIDYSTLNKDDGNDARP